MEASQSGKEGQSLEDKHRSRKASASKTNVCCMCASQVQAFIFLRINQQGEGAIRSEVMF